jgi:hypothetical protein
MATEVFDTDGDYDTVTTRFTVPSGAGKYFVYGNFAIVHMEHLKNITNVFFIKMARQLG